MTKSDESWDSDRGRAVRNAVDDCKPCPIARPPPLPIRIAILSFGREVSAAAWPLRAGGLVGPAWQVLAPFGASEIAAGEVAGHGLPMGRVKVEDDRCAVGA